MRIWTAVAISPWFSVLLYAQTAQVYYLPQVVDGPNSSGALRTTIVLTNVDTANATVQISFTSDNGSPRQLAFPTLGSGNQFSLNLKPGASQILQTDGSGDGSTGAATISSTAALGVATIVAAYDANGSPLSESGASSSDVSTAYRIPVDTTGGLNTGVGIFNPAATPSTLTFTLFDTNGTFIEKATATLGAHSHLSRFAAGDLFPDVSGLQGAMAVTASIPVAAVTIRQNAPANTYTLLDALPQSSLDLNSYLPQVADGPNGTGTLQTTFVVYNIGTNPATVTFSLSQDSGAPWIVNIPGLGNNDTFTVTLAAGGSAFLQTDGQGASTTGAATVSSTQPIGVAAVVTATDGSGNVLSETGMAQSAAQQGFVLAFDTSNNINTGLAFYNPTPEPVSLTVNQLDPRGNLIASSQSQPLDPGGHMAVYISDLFSGTTGVQGALSVTATGSVGASVAVLGLRQNATPVAFASTPVTSLPVTGTGINVTSTLDSKSKATSAITPAGGTLSLTDAKGNKFTLTIPADALLSTTTVTMTAVTAINGLPASASFIAGVQLEPDGLVLFQPATLTIKPISVVSPDLTIPLGWHGTGQGLYLNLVQPQPGDLTLVFDHFSGAAIASGPDSRVTALLSLVANMADLDTSEANFWINKARNDIAQGMDPSKHFADALEVLERGYSDYVETLMRIATETGDDNLLQCAATHAMSYLRQLLLNGFGSENAPPRQRAKYAAIKAAIDAFVENALKIQQKNLTDRCTQKHDPLAGLPLIANARQQLLLGLEADSSVLGTVLAQCPPNPLLNFSSDLSGNVQTPDGVGIFDGKVSAKFNLSGTPPPSLLPDKKGDGYVHYLVSGSGPLNYDSASFSLMGSACPQPVVSDKKGSTLRVMPQTHGINSEIKYQLSAKFDRNAVLKNGSKLSDFCPVYATTPASVTLIVNPGMPAETVTQPPCNGAGGTFTFNFWVAFWTIARFDAKTPDMGVFDNWQIPGMNSFAHKEIMQAVTGSGVTVIEITKLDLNEPQQ